MRFSIFNPLRLLITFFIVLASSQIQAKDTLEVGYMPILPVSQLFVGLEQGFMDDLDVEIKLVQFQNGPAMVQALLAGQLDVAHFGIGPAMVARAKGADIKVVASSIVEQISIVALGKIAPYFENGDHKTAFSRFAADNGRKPVITTFPVGSVPETVLQYWLRKQLNIDPDEVDIIYQGAAQVQQALLTDAVDGAAILEPAVTIVTSKSSDAKVVARGAELFPRQPGAILAVREALINNSPDLVKALVASHEKATQMLNNEDEATVKAVQKYVGGGRLSEELVKKAISGSKGSFVADPNFILEGTRTMHDFQAEIGTLKAKIDIDALFDTSFYDALK